MKLSLHKTLLASFYVLALAVVVRFAWEGLSYYSTPLVERPHHEDFWVLKPGGSRGHALGVAGSTLMVLMLLYSVRKRTKPLKRLGRLRAWLDWHIFCGIVGPLLVILHSSFKVQGLVALSFWSMIAVALSGVLGRYLYLQIPRSRAGDELTLAEVERQRGELARRLREDFQLPEEALQELDRLAAGDLGAGESLARLLFHLPFQAVSLRWRLRAWRRQVRERGGVPRPLMREMTRAARQRVVLTRRIVLLNRLQQLFHYWHVFHKPFAVVMYVFMVVHIAVALLTGYGWSTGP